MKLKLCVLSPMLGFVVAASLSAGAYVALPATTASADTHMNCVTFDNEGNILSWVPNCTQTIHAPTGSNSNPSADPCNQADTGTLTMTDSHDTIHVTVNGKGDIGLTNTDGGPVTFTPDDPTMPSGSGQWTSWFGASLWFGASPPKNLNSVLHGTSNMTVYLSDGTVVTNHETLHMSFSASGVQISFDKSVLTCGG
jgi:hypothetical protein